MYEYHVFQKSSPLTSTHFFGNFFTIFTIINLIVIHPCHCSRQINIFLTYTHQYVLASQDQLAASISMIDIYITFSAQNLYNTFILFLLCQPNIFQKCFRDVCVIDNCPPNDRVHFTSTSPLRSGERYSFTTALKFF